MISTSLDRRVDAELREIQKQKREREASLAVFERESTESREAGVRINEKER